MKRLQARLKSPGMLSYVFSVGRKEILFCAILSMFINLLALALPLYILQIFTHVLISKSLQTLWLVTLITLAALVAWGVLSEVRSRILRLLGEKMDVLLGDRVQRAMIRQAVQSNSPRTAAGLKDLATVRTAMSGMQTPYIFDVPWCPLFLGVIYILSPTLGTVAVFGILVLLTLAWLNDRFTRPPQKLASQAAEGELGFVLSSLRNAEVVEGMGMRSAIIQRWQEQHLGSVAHQGRAVEVGGLISNASRTFRWVLQVMIFGVAAYLVVNNEIGTGAMMASVYLLARGLAPVDGAIGIWRQITGAQAAFRRISDLLDAAKEPAQPLLKLPRPTGRLQASGVIFRRPDSPPVLKGLTFSIEPGESVGIVGPSAAGKSTLAKLIVGVWRPTAGTIRLDGADVTTWDPDDLGQYLGYLPQEVELFAGTVRDNIARMGPASDEEVIAAAQLAGAHDLILRLPKGYDTEIGESGSVLSGGQRQRIALARALFRNPCLVVLDEPNANLDGPGEEALVAALKRAKSAGSTVILITHKPALLFSVDKVMILNDGTIESYGPRNDVLPKILPQPQRKRLIVAEGQRPTG